MDSLSLVLLSLSVVLSCCRNVLSKGISDITFGTKSFFLLQGCLFVCGSVAIMLSGQVNFTDVAPVTAFYAIIYGCLLISTQWSYTAAMSIGSTGICSTVYSLGFIFPTLSGAIFWEETMTWVDALGVLCVIPAVVLSGTKKSVDENYLSGKSYIFFLVTAMLSAGGLGIMQKVQQSSDFPQQKAVFVLISFIFAGTLSLLFGIFKKSDSKKLFKNKLLMSCGIGVCFGICNLLNTSLAGRLNSAVFFPTLNISVILLSIIMGMVIFKEKLSKKDTLILVFGIAAILLLAF